MGVFKKEQLKEIPLRLEKSGQRFLWVVREPPSDDVNEFLRSDRSGSKKNWAPQSAIVNQDSVGGFVSHCGWNTSLEGVVAGVLANGGMAFVYRGEDEIKVALSIGNILLLGATTYMIWQERNMLNFQRKKRAEEVIIQLITEH
ncbi:UDP-glycosyltransferase 88B1-like protein [Tanacetum coccineum]